MSGVLHSGACYRAANWIEVGQTCGRGRQDRFTQAALSPKAIFVYPLENGFRARLDDVAKTPAAEGGFIDGC